MTSIEWTEATWNPIAGCSLHSPGCTNCYAMRTAARLATMAATAPVYAGLTQPSKAGPVWTGKIAVNESTMLAPLRRRKPTMYFVNSMSDLFHESVPGEVIDRVFAVMALCPQHTFQVLTKRSDRMRAYLAAHDTSTIGDSITDAAFMINGAVRGYRGKGGSAKWPLPNVWLGVSVEDQKRADERIPDLLATPAAVRFLSCEPLLGPVDLTRVRRFKPGVADREWLNAVGGRVWTDQSNLPNPDPSWSYPGRPFSEGRGIDWVIVGGESGPGARPIHPDWARSLRDQCAMADVPFFFKQWGEWMPTEYIEGEGEEFGNRFLDGSGRWATNFNGPWKSSGPRDGSGVDSYYRAGKKAAGRMLDGVTHNAMPQVHAHA
jgi:protein gp37